MWKSKFLLSFILLSTACAHIRIETQAKPFPICAGKDRNHPYAGTAIQLPDGKILVAYERWINDSALPFESHIWTVTINGTQVISQPIRLDNQEPRYTYYPHFVNDRQNSYIYFNVFDPKKNLASFERRVFEDGKFGPSQSLRINENLVGQFRPWIYPFFSENGQVVLTYEWRDPVVKKQRRRFSLSSDGVNFNESLDFGIGVMGRVSEFSSGRRIYTYQNGDPNQMRDYFSFSDDLTHWTPSLQVSSQKDVHDAIPFQRLDGKIDLYFLASDGGPRNSIFRRTVDLSGDLGSEERLTDKKDGSFMAPHPIRLRDGRVFLLLVKEVKEQSNYDLYGLYLDGDT